MLTVRSRFPLPFGLVLLGVVCLSGGTTIAAGDAPPASDPLLEQVEQAIDLNARRHLDVDVHTPWQIVHGVLALRQDLMVMQNGEKVRAIDWMSNGAVYRGTPLFHATRFGGRAQPFTKPYLFEGHPNQFLGYLSMSNLPLDHQIHTKERTITIADVVRNAQMDVKFGEEPGWTLWGLAHYLDPDDTWTNKEGEPWSIERLVRSQVYENVSTAACGGTHGLFALSYALNKYRETGRPLRGIWLEADQKVRRYIEEARVLQNPDGSFSSRFFQGRGHDPDPVSRLGASGHVLEFLMGALPDERLNEPWVRRGIASVARDLIETRRAPVDCGPLYHAVSALAIYRDRTRPTPPPEPPVEVVETQADEDTPEPLEDSAAELDDATDAVGPEK